MSKHGTIDGSVFHYDVPTKCQAVKKFLKEAKKLNRYVSKKEHREAIAKIYQLIALEYMVTVPSIKAWVRKYYYTYNDYIKATAGTMRIANVLVQEKDIIKTKKFLDDQKRKREELSMALDPMYEKKRGVRASFEEITELQIETEKNINRNQHD